MQSRVRVPSWAALRSSNAADIADSSRHSRLPSPREELSVIGVLQKLFNSRRKKTYKIMLGVFVFEYPKQRPKTGQQQQHQQQQQNHESPLSAKFCNNC